MPESDDGYLSFRDIRSVANDARLEQNEIYTDIILICGDSQNPVFEAALLGELFQWRHLLTYFARVVGGIPDNTARNRSSPKI